MKTLFRILAASSMLIGGATVYAQDDAPDIDREEVREHLQNARERLKANAERFSKHRIYHAQRKEILQDARERRREIAEMDEGEERDAAIAELRASIREQLKDLKEQRREAIRERRQNRETDVPEEPEV